MSYPYQGKQAAERIVWKSSASSQAIVGEWLAWLVAGTLHGIIPVREA